MKGFFRAVVFFLLFFQFANAQQKQVQKEVETSVNYSVIVANDDFQLVLPLPEGDLQTLYREDKISLAGEIACTFSKPKLFTSSMDVVLKDWKTKLPNAKQYDFLAVKALEFIGQTFEVPNQEGEASEFFSIKYMPWFIEKDGKAQVFFTSFSFRSKSKPAEEYVKTLLERGRIFKAKNKEGFSFLIESRLGDTSFSYRTKEALCKGSSKNQHGETRMVFCKMADLEDEEMLYFGFEEPFVSKKSLDVIAKEQIQARAEVAKREGEAQKETEQKLLREGKSGNIMMLRGELKSESGVSYEKNLYIFQLPAGNGNSVYCFLTVAAPLGSEKTEANLKFIRQIWKDVLVNRE